MKRRARMSLQKEIIVRLIVIVFFFYTDKLPGFIRTIQKEEYWLYSFPRTEDFYPSLYLWCTIAFTPIVVGLIAYQFTRDRVDLIQFLLGWFSLADFNGSIQDYSKSITFGAYFSTFLAGSITNVVKLGVGRPRPDFLERCFPDGKIEDSMKCTGDPAHVIDGYKSFPSGHSSLSFSCLAFISLYIAGKLHVFSSQGRGSSWKVICFIMPSLWATMIAVSRTADYHHHWQDVTVGSCLGLVVAYLVYRMHYPALQRNNSHLPHVSLAQPETFISTIDQQIPPMTPPPYGQQLGFDSLKLV